MKKLKASKSAAKRFKVTGTGKLRRRSAMKSHLLEKKSPKRKRLFARDLPLAKGDAKTVDKLLGRR